MSDPLCEICEELELVNVFRQEYGIKVSENETDLRVVADIRDRSEICTLCSTINVELDKEIVGGDDICYLRQNMHYTIGTDDVEKELASDETDDSNGGGLHREI